MPKLKCQVEQCIYNYDWLCAKNYIDVDGSNARSKKETFCNSYECRSNNNNVEFAVLDGTTPSMVTEVYCDVTNCVFERGQRCYADRIEIKNVNGSLHVNPSQGVSPEVTSCQTFEYRD